MRKQIGFKISEEMLKSVLFEKQDIDIIDIKFNRDRNIITFYLQSDSFDPLYEGDEVPDHGIKILKLKGSK